MDLSASPKGLDEKVMTGYPCKDDGFGPDALENLCLMNPFIACTSRRNNAGAYGIDPKGKHAVIVGRSNCRKTSALLLLGNTTVTTCHSRTLILGRVSQGRHTLRCNRQAKTITGDM